MTNGTVFECVANSLFLGVALVRPNQTGPAILVNYHPEQTDIFTTKLLQPYGRPDRCIVALNLEDEVLRIVAKTVLPVAAGTVLTFGSISHPGPCAVVLGCDHRVAVGPGFMRFMEQYQADRRFTFGVGYHRSKSLDCVDFWHVDLTSMLGSDVDQRVDDLISVTLRDVSLENN